MNMGSLLLLAIVAIGIIVGVTVLIMRILRRNRTAGKVIGITAISIFALAVVVLAFTYIGAYKNDIRPEDVYASGDMTDKEPETQAVTGKETDLAGAIESEFGGVSTTEREPADDISEPEPTDEATEESEIENIDIDWQEYSFDFTDNSGYSYTVALKLSPMALFSSSSNYINSAWSEIGTGHTLPASLSEWDLQDKGWQDMYYSVGTISIKNRTEGWDFTESSPGNVQITLKTQVSTKAVKVFARNTTLSGLLPRDNVQINPNMTSNFVEYPIAICIPEIFNPNYPDGQQRTLIRRSSHDDFILNCWYKEIGGVTVPFLDE